MKVLFIIPQEKELNGFPYFGNNGVLSIASFLKSLGHAVLIKDRTLKVGNIRKVLNSFNPDIVAISFISCSALKDAVKVSKLSHAKGIPVIWGGYGPIAYPEVILKEEYVDFVSTGEGEGTLHDLLNAMSENGTYEDIPGLAYRGEAREIKVNPKRPLQAIDALPRLEYSLINPAEYHFPFYTCKSMIYIYDGKGCPCQCKFCANKSFNECTSRSRNLDDVVTEINLLYEKYGFDGFFLTRELFAVNKEELYHKCNKLSKVNPGAKWGAMVRSDMFSKEEFDYMYKSGCRWLFFGIESASETVLNNMKKRINTADAKQCIVDCHRAGIMPFASFIFGFIGATEEDLKKTVTYIKDIFSIAKISCTFFSPAFCSDSYNELVETGRLKEPEKIEQIGVSKQTKLSEDYSLINKKDLKVIYYYFMFQSIIAKKIYPEKQGTVLAENFFIFSKYLFGFGIKHCVKTMFNYLLFGKNLLFYTFAFPRIRRKYKLPLKISADANIEDIQPFIKDLGRE